MNTDPNATFDIPTFHEDFAGLLGTQWARGRFKLTKLLGQGTFGAVFEATDELFQSQPKAIKLSVAISSDKLFFREAKLLGEIKHDSVVKVHEYGVEEGIPYIVMDLLEGDSVDKLLKKYDNRLPDRLLAKFVREIGSALHNVHLKNLVHRDLKPNNIIFAKTGSVDHLGQPVMRYVLLDFGIAGRIDPTTSLRQTSMQGAGTLEYMAPEQAQSQESTNLTDVYSFGVMLYQFLTGRVPFPATGNTHLAIAQVITALINSPPPAFKEVAPQLDIKPEIEELVMQCLEKDPKKRPESILAVSNKFLELTGFNFTSELSIPEQALLSGASSSEVSQSHQGTRPSRASLTVVTGAQSAHPPRTLLPLTIIVPGILFLSAAAGYFIWKDRFGQLPVPPAPAVIHTNGETPAPPTPPPFAVNSPPRLEIPAGSTKELFLSFVNGGTGPATIQTKSQLEGISLPPTLESDTSILQLPIAVDVNSPPGEKTLVLLAKQGELTKELTTIIDVQAPKVWLPGSKNFTLSHSGKIVTIDGTNYYEKLAYHVPGEPSVDFVLIDPRTLQGEKQSPFYMMENKVWNSLFAKFAAENSDVKFENSQLLKPGTEEWNRLPAVNMNWNEAVRFGRWLAGDSVQLPTIRQWWIATGYFDRDRLPEFSQGPYRNESDAVVAKPSYTDKFYPVGSEPGEISSRGVRDLSTNGKEWTSSLFAASQPVAQYPITDPIVSIFTPGAAPRFSRITFDIGHRLFGASTNSVNKSLSAVDSFNDCGFRLVITVDRTQ